MTDSTTIAISRAAPADAPAINAALARAFYDDPVFAWVLPDDAARRERLPAVFAAFTDAYLPLGETYLAGPDTGAALWAPPGTQAITDDRAEEFGTRLTEVLAADAGRVFELDRLLSDHHPAEPCWYLNFIGVVPGHQGRGIGGRLLGTVLQRADADATPAYLDATSPDNRRLYERHGFTAIDEMKLPEGPYLWSMWRDPAPARTTPT